MIVAHLFDIHTRTSTMGHPRLTSPNHRPSWLRYRCAPCLSLASALVSVVASLLNAGLIGVPCALGISHTPPFAVLHGRHAARRFRGSLFSASPSMWSTVDARPVQCGPRI